jgi:hypothetical protein
VIPAANFGASPASELILAWTGTYLVHSTLLLALAATATILVRADGWRDAIWKTALVGGIATATASVLLFGERDRAPLSGRWYAPVATAAAPASHEAAVSSTPAVAPSSMLAPASNAPDSVQRTTSWPVSAWLLAAWATIAATLLARIGWRHRTLLWELGTRAPVRDQELLETLARLRRRAGVWHDVRLTMSPACPTPVVLNRREICVPVRFVDDLRPDQQRAALAHELAHVARHDPLWQRLAAVMSAALFFQPLNRLARVRLRECAEFLCDDWAARQTGEPMGLASCLTEVAGWIGSATVPRATLAMSEGGASLLQRIERLTSWSMRSRSAAAPRVMSMLSVLGGVTFVAPLVDTTRNAPPLPSTAPILAESIRSACPYTREDSTQFETAGVRRVRIDVPSGAVRVDGATSMRGLSARGRRCASSEAVLEGLTFRVSRVGDELRVQVAQPTHLFSRTKGTLANVDVHVQVPTGMPVTLVGGSGDVQLRDIGAVSVRGGMGRYEITNATGPVDLAPELADIVVFGVRGDVRMRDALGDVDIRQVVGDVSVASTHSGTVRIRNVRGAVRVPKGHTGDIEAMHIDGDLDVGRLAEGAVRHARVGGRVRVDSISDAQRQAATVEKPERR